MINNNGIAPGSLSEYILNIKRRTPITIIIIDSIL